MVFSDPRLGPAEHERANVSAHYGEGAPGLLNAILSAHNLSTHGRGVGNAMSAQAPFAPPPPQEWLTPAFLPPSPYGEPEPAKSPAIFELRPLTLSEVLDRTFSLYRSRFWLFAGISAISAAIQALVAAGQLVNQGHVMGQILNTA